MKPSLRTIWIGDATRSEFETARRSLLEATELVTFTEPGEAAEALEEGAVCDLLLVAQSRPGEFSAEAWRRLRQAAPIAPAVLLLGSWMEGEQRTGHPLEGAVQVYWHAWPQFFERQLALLRAGKRPDWTVPETATAADQLLERQAVARTPARPGHVLIVSADRAMSDLLRDTFAREEWQIEQAHPSDSTISSAARLLVFDMPDTSSASTTVLVEFRARHPDAALVVLAGFPREGQTRKWEKLGATVISKPFSILDFRFWISD